MQKSGMVMEELIQQMRSGTLKNPRIERLTSELAQRLSLSRQKEFKRIKNLVIEEAVQLGRYTEIFDPMDGQELTAGARSRNQQLRRRAQIIRSCTMLSRIRIWTLNRSA